MSAYVPLPGSTRTLLKDSRSAGPVDYSEIASITVRVRAALDPETLVKKAYELSNTPLSQREYLTHAELERQHGARPEDLNAIEHFAQQHDLTVIHRSATERSIILSGTLGNLLLAFRADVQIYHHATGPYRGRRGAIGIPAELSHIITGVFGFDTRPKQRSPHRQKRAAQKGPGKKNGEIATKFAKRYKFPEKYKGTALDGSGQTIAIIELGGGYRSSDLKVYFSEVDIPMPNVSSISVDFMRNRPGARADGEVMMDIEVAGSVAPKANIAVYFAHNTNQGFLGAISAAIHDVQRKPSVISISWGSPESSISKQDMKACHEMFAVAAAMGITVCVSSGDHGTADEETGDWDGRVNVDHPACDDLVLGCGGTQITAGKDVVWNEPADEADGVGWASGGGISQMFDVPVYQSAVRLPTAIHGGHAGRGVPDIAMTAKDYFTRVDADESSSGGTSAVAPLMAGLVARLNQAKQKNVGFLNPLLYAKENSALTNTVLSGTNKVSDKIEFYKAARGWSACTGLGTPDGSKILKALR